jgi:putative DNA primase/helicase
MTTIEKPISLPVQFDAIPNQLKKTPRWVLWRYVLIGEAPKQKWSKLPVQPSGKSASTTDQSTWNDFFTAMDAYQRGHFDGVGFVFDGTDNLVGIDLDDCYSTQTNGFTNAALQHIADSVDGYMEVSPSGTGVKIFTYADLQAGHVDHSKGLEIYKSARYFTVTGHKISGEIPAVFQDLSSHIPERTIKHSGDSFADYSPPIEDWDIGRIESELLAHLDSNGYEDWLQVGQILHHQTCGDFEGLELWDRWSQNGTEYQANACDKKWLTFGKKGGLTLRSLIFKVSQQKLKVALDAGLVVLDANNPVANARRFLESEFSCVEGTKLVHYTDDWFSHLDTHYELIEEQTIRSNLYKFLDKCVKQVKGGDMAPFNPNPANVSAILDSTKALVHLENKQNTRPPVWLSGYANNRPDASKLISLENGIFHFEQNILIPHSLEFFTTNSLPFLYDPSAQCPNWLKFLNDLWGEDEESKNLLQEYMAYVLSGDTRQQKMLQVVGPRRAGKGTIVKIMTSLLGQHNTISPQVDELVDTFALQPWLGKLLATFSDARLTGKNTSGIVSQLLRIVGGDSVTVNRKNKEAWNGYLPTRIMLFSNEALQLSESSNALMGRMLVLSLKNNFYGKEDVNLIDRLEKELSGIFNWCLEGNQRRTARDGGRFIQPQSGRDLLETMEEIGNPLLSFIDDVLIYDPQSIVNKDDVFACYKKWAAYKNINIGSDMSFSRRFLASTQDNQVTTVQIRENERRVRVYRGIKLTDKAQSFVDSIDSFTADIF